MRLTNLFKCLIYIFTFVLTIFIIYLSIITCYQAIQGYYKASWYYSYNEIQSNEILPETIGYTNDTYIEKNKIYYMNNYVFDLVCGKQLTQNQDLIIPIDLALELNQNIEELLYKSYGNYTIVGITSQQCKERRVYTLGQSNDTIQEILIHPNVDMEKMAQNHLITLHSDAEIRLYINKLVRSMKITSMAVFVFIALLLVFIRMFSFDIKTTLFYNIACAGLSVLCLNSITDKFNQYLNVDAYLEVSSYFYVLIAVCIFMVIGFTAIKKIKFFYSNKKGLTKSEK